MGCSNVLAMMPMECGVSHQLINEMRQVRTMIHGGPKAKYIRLLFKQTEIIAIETETKGYAFKHLIVRFIYKDCVVGDEHMVEFNEQDIFINPVY